jgi:hypothetical protein
LQHGWDLLEDSKNKILQVLSTIAKREEWISRDILKPGDGDLCEPERSAAQPPLAWWCLVTHRPIKQHTYLVGSKAFCQLTFGFSLSAFVGCLANIKIMKYWLKKKTFVGLSGCLDGEGKELIMEG